MVSIQKGDRMRITNSILEHFVKLTQEKTLIENQLKDLKELIINQNGAQTQDFIAIVKEISRNQVAGQKEFEIKMGKKWLETQGLIKIITYKQVQVLEKPSRVAQLFDMPTN